MNNGGNSGVRKPFENQRSSRKSVMLTTEGTYPFYHGGVSVWCDQLVRHLPEADFHLFAVTHSPRLQPVFDVPENVLSVNRLALWGTEEPGMTEIPFSEAYNKKLLSTPEAIRSRFIPAFETVVRGAFAGLKADPLKFANAMLAMQLYFEEHDYAVTLTDSQTWNCFLKCARTQERFLLEDATTCMRWLLRYLAITARPLRRANVVHASMAGLATSTFGPKSTTISRTHSRAPSTESSKIPTPLFSISETVSVVVRKASPTHSSVRK